jgi:hypothetical protein
MLFEQLSFEGACENKNDEEQTTIRQVAICRVALILEFYYLINDDPDIRSGDFSPGYLQYVEQSYRSPHALRNKMF